MLLTNGHLWQPHRIRFEQQIDHDLVFEIDLLSDEATPSDLLEQLYLVSREAGSVSVIDMYWQSKEATSRYVLAHVVLSDGVLHAIRRQVRSRFKETRVTTDELAGLLQSEVIKRELLEGDKAEAAAKTVKRAVRRRRPALGTTENEEVPASAPIIKTASAPDAAAPAQQSMASTRR